jgi:predicted nucleotidyltransferase
MSHVDEKTKHIAELARRFADATHPRAAAVFLGGSWARGTAHERSDIDVVIFDDTEEAVSFEGLQFEGVVVEVCSMPTRAAETLFAKSIKRRSPIIPDQVANGLLVKGEPAEADAMRALAAKFLADGPPALSESAREDLRFEITVLREDIERASGPELAALAALAYGDLARAVLDVTGAWRTARKSRLRGLLASADPYFCDRLDRALAAAVHGENGPMVEACTEILGRLGGPQRTYSRFTV